MHSDFLPKMKQMTSREIEAFRERAKTDPEIFHRDSDGVLRNCKGNTILEAKIEKNEAIRSEKRKKMKPITDRIRPWTNKELAVKEHRRKRASRSR